MRLKIRFLPNATVYFFFLRIRTAQDFFLYTGHPYGLYRDGQLIQKGLTDDGAAIVYEREEGACYQVKTPNGCCFDAEPQADISGKSSATGKKMGRTLIQQSAQR
jgi:hypothetical protein